VRRRIARAAVAAFDPRSAAVAEPVRGHEITIDCPEERTLAFDGETLTIEAGVSHVRESVGVFLMARGEAGKAPEPN
jgi:DNA primase small subunit